jgi:flavin reductase (DIM6/NTAB) family NADH-FMN oxidoreductase RutF
MEKIMYNDFAKEALRALSKGVFLSVSDNGEDNIMTIAWGSIGFMWNKPVFMVMVRYSRHTYQLIEKAGEFAVSIPLKNDLSKQLVYCGSKSGRDCNKWKDLGLTKVAAEQVKTPLVGECELHYTCKIIGRQEVTDKTIMPHTVETFYSQNDYHVIYYGEIVGTYLK